MNKLIEQLKRHEGFRSKVYKDSAGILTIGYGTNLEHRGVSELEAELMLYTDVRHIKASLNKHVWFTELNDVRQEAIINMAYNLGINGLLKFKKMIYYLKEQNYDMASKEALDSKWAKQVGKRALELSTQIKTGMYK